MNEPRHRVAEAPEAFEPPAKADAAVPSSPDATSQDQATTLEDGMLLDYISNQPVKDTAKEQVRQRIARDRPQGRGQDPLAGGGREGLRTAQGGNGRGRQLSLGPVDQRPGLLLLREGNHPLRRQVPLHGRLAPGGRDHRHAAVGLRRPAAQGRAGDAQGRLPALPQLHPRRSSATTCAATAASTSRPVAP